MAAWSTMRRKLEYPYQSVYDGKWTYDMMMDYCKDTYSDVNGSSTADEADRYGFVTNNTWTSLFMFAADEIPAICGKDGFTFNLFSERISNIMDDLVAQKHNPDIWYAASGNPYAIFEEGRALFEAYGSDPELLRDIEFDYGYLPYPKYDEAQEDYVVWSSGGMMSVPITATDINRTGAIVEALSAGSQKYVEEAFVQSYFEGKILRDEDSVKIYRMMRDRATYVISHNIDPADKLASFKFYVALLNDETLGAASYWASIKDSVEAAYKNLYDIANESED